MAELIRLFLGTVIYRPYVYIFFICFLFFSIRHLKGASTLLYILFSYSIALGSELSATRNGFPFGKYVYLDETRTRELWISNVPFWDSLSFVFLSYFSWIVASTLRNPSQPSLMLLDKKTAFLGGWLMMLLDLVIDPIALRGDRWFLGKIYYYPNGGSYFGVTLSNFAGWWFVGTVTLLIFQRLSYLRIIDSGRWAHLTRFDSWGALGVYAGVFSFNLAMTAWIRYWELFFMSLGITLLTLVPCYFFYSNVRRTDAKDNTSNSNSTLCRNVI